MKFLVAGVEALLVETMILLVRGYQLTLSPYVGQDCLFQPTCSNYFIKAVRKYGSVQGALMGAWRIARCNPLSKGGFDPP